MKTSFLSALLAALVILMSCDKSPTSPAPPFSSDKIPPAAITDLAVTNVTPSRINLTWTTPGDDGMVGNAYMYDARFATFPITNSTWKNASPWRSLWFVEQPPSSNTTSGVARLQAGTTYYFAVKTLDENNNWSALSNVVSAMTLPGGRIKWVSTIPSSGAEIVTSHNSFLYLQLYWGIGRALVAFDLSDPSAPFMTAEQNLISSPTAAQGVGDKIYVLSRTCSYGRCGPSTLTIAGALPAPMEVLGRCVFNDSGFLTQGLADMVTDGEYVFLGHRDSLIVVDVRDSSRPVPDAPYHLPVDFHVSRLLLGGSTLVVVGGSGTCIVLLDVSNPTNMRTAAIYDVGAEPGCCALSDGVLYLVLNTHDLIAVDVSDPTSPATVGRIAMPYYPVSMAVQGDYAYVWGYNQFYAVSMKDPSSPVIVDSCDFSNGSLMADENYIHVAYGDGVDIFRSELR